MDSGRLIHPNDGQDVINLLETPGALAEVEESVPEDAVPEEDFEGTEDMGESDPPFSSSQNSSMVDMLYGEHGVFSASTSLPSPLRLGG